VLPRVAPRSLALALLLVAVPVRGRAAPELPAAHAGAGDRSKDTASSDLRQLPDKLPAVPKVKECCGYPVGEREGFRLSFYWLAYESEYANEDYDTDIYDKNGFWIGRYPSAFVFELKLEGTGVLRDGRVLNYAGECGYGIGTCFEQMEMNEHPLGRGVQHRRLVPFRSVAVDPRYIPIGSTIYVPEIVGMVLPDGTHHDGCLRADDQGGAIKQHKLDFFVESYFNFKYLADQLWWRLKATPHLDEPRCAYMRLGEPPEHQNEHTDWALIHSKQYQKAQALALRAEKRRALHRTQLASRARAERHSTKKHTTVSALPTAGKRGQR
jgi:3D (Asp-Asp-Asp) domain-containing protein